MTKIWAIGSARYRQPTKTNQTSIIRLPTKNISSIAIFPARVQVAHPIFEEMAHHEQYMLRVTAGATYDASTHQEVLVNMEKAVRVQSDLIDATVHMRIKDYRGLF